MWKPPQRIRFEPASGHVPTPRGSRAVAPLLARPRRRRSRSSSAAGFRRWCRGARPSMASSTEELIAMVRPLRARPARRHRGRGDRHPRRAERAAPAHRRRSLPPGPRRIVDAVRAGSEGHTKLFIQLIDFLAIRRRPDPQALFRRVPDGHGAASRGARRVGAPGRRNARAPRGAAARGAGACPCRARARGARRRLPRAGDRSRARRMSATLPQVLPDALRRSGGRARAGCGVRRRRAALRARLHHGVVPLGHQHARATVMAARARTAAPAAARGLSRGARARRRRLSWSAAASSPRSASKGGSGVEDAVLFRRRRSRRPAWISSRPRAAASSTTPSSPASARRPIPIPAPAATNACRSISPTSTGPFGRNIAATAAIRARHPRGRLRNAGRVHRRRP